MEKLMETDKKIKKLSIISENFSDAEYDKKDINEIVEKLNEIIDVLNLISINLTN